VFLNFEWQAVEIFFVFKQNSCAVIVPEIAEMIFNSLTQLFTNVSAASIGLVLNSRDQLEPLLN
jgi:hypothetical protein